MGPQMTSAPSGNFRNSAIASGVSSAKESTLAHWSIYAAIENKTNFRLDQFIEALGLEAHELPNLAGVKLGEFPR